MKKIHICLLLLLTGCAAPQKDDYVAYVGAKKVFKTNAAPLYAKFVYNQIDLRGDYDPDDAFAMNSIMYSGDAGVVGMLAQVAVHAAISNNAQDSRISAQQLEANKVLEPLSGVLTNLSTKQLQFTSEQLIWLAEDQEYPASVLMSKPIFFLSQDARVLSLKHVISVESSLPKSGSKKNKQKLYSNLIEVVSAPLPAEDAMDYWLANNATALTVTMQALYIKSVELALADLKGELAQSDQAETFTVEISDKLRIERGNKITADCRQLVLRNLRGWIIALPAPQTIDNEMVACPLS